MLHEETDDPLSLKEIKVRIPVSFHLKLHAFKVLKGKPISDTIVEALDAYFKAAEARKHIGESGLAGADHVATATHGPPGPPGDGGPPGPPPRVLP